MWSNLSRHVFHIWSRFINTARVQSRGLSSQKSILIKMSRFLLNALHRAWLFLPGVILLLTYAISYPVFSPTTLSLLPRWPKPQKFNRQEQHMVWLQLNSNICEFPRSEKNKCHKESKMHLPSPSQLEIIQHLFLSFFRKCLPGVIPQTGKTFRCIYIRTSFSILSEDSTCHAMVMVSMMTLVFMILSQVMFFLLYKDFLMNPQISSNFIQPRSGRVYYVSHVTDENSDTSARSEVKWNPWNYIGWCSMIHYPSRERSLGAAERGWPTDQLPEEYGQDTKPLRASTSSSVKPKVIATFQAWCKG